MLADQFWVLPSLLSFNYGFVSSTNPGIFQFDGYPAFGSEAGVNEPKKIKDFADGLKETRQKRIADIRKGYEMRGINYQNRSLPVDLPLSDRFPTIYMFPKEADYFPQQIKDEYRLWRIDSVLSKDQIPKPFELPADFKQLPYKTIYVSLGGLKVCFYQMCNLKLISPCYQLSGTLFSMYTSRYQRLLDMLDRLPYKYIVSLGPNGDKIRLPSSKFIGANHLNQLACLQSSDAAIVHGIFLRK